MKCKNCGGELKFQNDKFICQSCSATFALDNFYENTEVFICYKETDSSGRRTKDSIVAQEVYRKLEDSDINTFNERISADGMVADDLEMSRHAALSKAKAVLILGASADNFAELEEKYGDCFGDKKVIPFCVGVSPNEISKTLGSIQAVNYSSIGWDKDLVNSICNLLGKEKKADSVDIYGKARKKRAIIIGIVIALLIILGVVALLLFSNFGRGDDTTTTQPTTVATKTQQEIYNEAMELWNQSKYIQALELFCQIPEHTNSANMIKQIYAKYEGFYQSDNIVFHLEIVNNTRAEMELTITLDEQVVKTSVSTEIYINKADCSYLDNHDNSGKLELTLVENGLKLTLKSNPSVDDAEVFLDFTKKTDMPTTNVDMEQLLDLLAKQAIYSDLVALGYELEEVTTFGRAAQTKVYKINYTEIYLSFFGEYTDGATNMYEGGLFGIAAPAQMIAPSLVGKEYRQHLENDTIYCPNAYLGGEWPTFYYLESEFDEFIISKTTLIGMTKKELFEPEDGVWESLVEGLVWSTVEYEAKQTYVSGDYTRYDFEIVAENDTHILTLIRFEELEMCAWYKVDKETYTATFVKEGPYKLDKSTYRISEDLWFRKYMDFAVEFPDAFDIKPGSAEWDELIEDMVYDKIYDIIRERYPQDDGRVSYGAPAENDTHILIPAYSQTLEDAGMCEWYKCSKTDGTITLVRDGIYVSYGSHSIHKYLWFTEYREFAKEFPLFYGDPDTVNLPYLSGDAFSVTVTDDDCWIYMAPSYDADVVEDDYGWIKVLPEGTYTIVEVEHDKWYRPWGKLKSGEGWVCLDEFFK